MISRSAFTARPWARLSIAFTAAKGTLGSCSVCFRYLKDRALAFVQDQLNSFTYPNGSRSKHRNQAIKLQSLGNVKSSTDDFKAWKVLYYSPIAASTSLGDFSSTLRQGLLCVKDVERHEKSQKQERELIQAVKKNLEASGLRNADAQCECERMSFPILSPRSPCDLHAPPTLKEQFHGVELERGQPCINMAIRNINLNKVDPLDGTSQPTQATPSLVESQQNNLDLDVIPSAGSANSSPSPRVPSTPVTVSSTPGDPEAETLADATMGTGKEEPTVATTGKKEASGKKSKPSLSKGRAMLGSPVGQLMGPRSGAGRRQGIMQTQSNVVQHMQGYRRSRTPTPVKSHKWRRQQKRKAKAKSQWEYKAGVYIEGTLEEILREGLIKDDRLETNGAESRLPLAQRLMLSETGEVANEQSSIMNYFGAQPFAGGDDGQKADSGWDLSNLFSSNSTLGESRKFHEYLQDAMASSWTMKKIEVALRPLKHPKGWQAHAND